jgi:hypothetical protein
MPNTKTDTKKKLKNIKFLIVEKNGDIKDAEIKEEAICAEELAKKCKFKKTDGYIKRTEWGYSFKCDNGESSKIVVEMWAKDDGLANHENKYEFPPPLDHDLYFGACALIARDYKNSYTDLTEDMWDDIYEYLFGGFESLVANEDDDEEEYDELDDIPSNRKTRDGYLKDGFVVDAKRRTDIREEEDSCGDSDEDDEDDDDSETDDSSDDDDDDDICEKSEEESDEGDADCFGKKTKKGVNNISNKNIIIEKNKDKIPIVSSRLVSGGDNKIKNIKDKSKDKYKEKDGAKDGAKDVAKYMSKDMSKDMGKDMGKDKDKYKPKDKNKDKDKNKEKDEDCDNGWKTDESSELSEEEYSYSK